MKRRNRTMGFRVMPFVGVLLSTLVIAIGAGALCAQRVCAAEISDGTAPGQDEDVIPDGVYADDINLSGMTAQEAEAAITAYVEELKEVQITLIAGGGNEVVVTAKELGLTWSNTELVQEALELCTVGNVIERYTAMKDLQYENKVYEIEFSYDLTAINDILDTQCAAFDQEAVNASLTRENGTFTVVAGQTGYSLDVENSIDIVYDYMKEEWTGSAASITLKVDEEEPEGTEEDLAQVTDVLGTFTTSFASSGTARSANVTNGCYKINGITLYPGEEFSTYETVSPFTEENGYYMAGSYLNGKVVDSLGGGICQVSTTLYNAVLLAELEVTERYNHSMVVSYVAVSMDAAISESAGKDFCFVNNTDYPIYIEGYVYNKTITFTIYGKETRDSNRVVSYESEILETIYPESDVIYQDASQPIGYYVSGDSAHIGYKARLWKIVTVDGVEVSREQVNSSTYKMTARSATVGTATDDPDAYNEIIAAIGTGSIDHVKNVIAILTAEASASDTSSEESQEVIENESPAE